MEQPATSTTVTGPVGERLQAGTEYAPVLDGLAPLRRLRDSGAGYKYPELPGNRRMDGRTGREHRPDVSVCQSGRGVIGLINCTQICRRTTDFQNVGVVGCIRQKPGKTAAKPECQNRNLQYSIHGTELHI